MLGFMRMPRVRAIACFVVVVGVLILALALKGVGPSVSLTVRGFTTNSWRTDNLDGSRKYVVCAIVEFTNAGRCPVHYSGHRHSDFVHHALLYPTPTGWKDPTAPVDYLGLYAYTLAPSQAVVFEAEIDPAKPCKIAVDYSDSQRPSRLSRRLPRWIVQRLPWAGSSRKVTTDEIELVSTGP